jgi:hypothetical protein
VVLRLDLRNSSLSITEGCRRGSSDKSACLASVEALSSNLKKKKKKKKKQARLRKQRSGGLRLGAGRD